MSLLIKKIWYGDYGIGKAFVLYLVVNLALSILGSTVINSTDKQPSTSLMVIYYIMSVLVWGYLLIGLSNAIKKSSATGIYKITAEVLILLTILMKLGVSADIPDKGLRYATITIVLATCTFIFLSFRRSRSERFSGIDNRELAVGLRSVGAWITSIGGRSETIQVFPYRGEWAKLEGWGLSVFPNSLILVGLFNDTDNQRWGFIAEIGDLGIQLSKIYPDFIVLKHEQLVEQARQSHVSLYDVLEAKYKLADSLQMEFEATVSSQRERSSTTKDGNLTWPFPTDKK